jgi:membrane-bound metal-dependent hydrolase YbcI (DUF457 family)
MTPLGHLSVSYLSARSVRRVSVPAVIIGGFLPDLDFLFLSSDRFNMYHHVVTHNIFFLGIAALIAYLITDKQNRLVVALSIFFGGFLHLMADSIMDNNFSNGVGVAVLWPLSKWHFSPFNLLTDSGVKAGWGKPLKMVRPMLIEALYELPLYIISIILLIKGGKVRSR